MKKPKSSDTKTSTTETPKPRPAMVANEKLIGRSIVPGGAMPPRRRRRSA